MNLNLFNLLILVGCAQGFFLSILLVRSTNFRRKSNGYLALTIFSFSLNNFYYFLFDIGLVQIYPVIFFLPLSWTLLIPVAFYFFITYLIKPEHQPSLTEKLLFFPFLIDVLFKTSTLFAFLLNRKWLAEHISIYNQLNHSIEILSMILAITLLGHGMQRVFHYQRNLKNNFSAIDNRTLGWLRNLMYALLALWFLWSLPYVYELVTNQFSQWHHYPLWIGMSIVIYWIGYSAYTRREVFEPALFQTPEKTEPVLSEKTDDHYQNLLTVMKTKKPYLNPELSLELLAADVELSAGYVSQIINKKEKSNFYDFINRYRVEEAKELLANAQFNHYSLLAIGQEAGFNSKTTFNTAFKRYAGVTPSQFKKELPSAA
ncbi:MAG: helix-turn-helix transcriptional regulator [Cyclobacteriaceae bacterium]|nr:helix-turn-helix transcriptional regulator [Cyclobacteriaceae bacterium]